MRITHCALFELATQWGSHTEVGQSSRDAERNPLVIRSVKIVNLSLRAFVKKAKQSTINKAKF